MRCSHTCGISHSQSISDMYNTPPGSALLDLLFGTQATAVAAAKRLTASEWTALMPAIREHRLAPLLFARLQRLDMPAALPTTLLQTITHASEQSTRRSLRLKAELIRLHRLLDNTGIPYAALKGAYVAFVAYPQSALRPMRDLDILVHPSDALRVFNLLQQQAGYARETQYSGSPVAAMQVSKHLPALRNVNSGISIEIHHRLISPDSAKIDLAEDPALWDRIIRHPLGADHVAFLSPTECLLHLLEHAVYDHYLNNGPLILSDIHHLIQKSAIDWALFERRAAACGITAGCQLGLALTRRFQPELPLPADLVDTVDDAALNDAQALLLRSFSRRGATEMVSELQSRSGARLTGLLSRILPSRTVMASRYPASADSWRVLLYYPVLWQRLLLDRLPKILASLRDRKTLDEVAQLQRLRTWLGD